MRGSGIQGLWFARFGCLSAMDKAKREGLVDGAQGPVSIVWGSCRCMSSSFFFFFFFFVNSLSGLL